MNSNGNSNASNTKSQKNPEDYDNYRVSVCNLNNRDHKDFVRLCEFFDIKFRITDSPTTTRDNLKTSNVKIAPDKCYICRN